MGLYLIPQFAGVRGAAVDLSPLMYLKDHLGWQRAYALDGIIPNYGSFYDVPFIDHESLPVSDSWIHYVRASLDPDTDAVTFSGGFPPPASNRAAALRHNLNNFKEAGVKFVTAPRNTDPLAEKTQLLHAAGGNIPVYLNEGEQITGSLPNPPASVASVQAVGVMVGTDGGAATGILQIQLCSGSACVSGSANLLNAADNAQLPLHLNSPLAIDPAAPLHYTLTHIESGHPIAIWMFPAQPTGTATLPGGKTSDRTPDVSIVISKENQEIRPVFESATQDIFELSNPAPYFDVAASPCRITIESHRSLHASCGAAGTLIRRELFYPGWRASINGAETALRASSIFQAIDLPAGESEVEFRYLPTNIVLSCSAGVLGLALILAGNWRRLA